MFTGQKLNRLIDFIHRIEDGLLALLLSSMILLACSQILLRNLFESGLVWADPVLRIMVLWMGLSGAMVASRNNKHISIDVFSGLLKGRLLHFIRILTHAFTTIVAGFISWHALRFVQMEFTEQSTLFNDLPAWAFEAILPVAFGIIALRYLIWMFIELQLFVKGSVISEQQRNHSS